MISAGMELIVGFHSRYHCEYGKFGFCAFSMRDLINKELESFEDGLAL